MNKFKPEIKQDKPLNSIIREMEVGDSETYPIERLNSVKNACSTLGVMLNRKYASSVNREERTITITRTL